MRIGVNDSSRRFTPDFVDVNADFVEQHYQWPDVCQQLVRFRSKPKHGAPMTLSQTRHDQILVEPFERLLQPLVDIFWLTFCAHELVRTAKYAHAAWDSLALQIRVKSNVALH